MISDLTEASQKVFLSADQDAKKNLTKEEIQEYVEELNDKDRDHLKENYDG